MIRKVLVETITDACLFWMPIDLLYLYFAGAWIEPNKIILYAEFVLLFGVPLLAIYRVIKFMKEIDEWII